MTSSNPNFVSGKITISNTRGNGPVEGELFSIPYKMDVLKTIHSVQFVRRVDNQNMPPHMIIRFDTIDETNTASIVDVHLSGYSIAALCNALNKLFKTGKAVRGNPYS